MDPCVRCWHWIWPWQRKELLRTRSTQIDPFDWVHEGCTSKERGA
jgi:hypothetical protein